MDDITYSNQVAYYHDVPNKVEFEVKLKYPDYQVYVNGEKVCHITVLDFEKDKVIKIPFSFSGRGEYYAVFVEDEDEVFIMEKHDGKRYYQRTIVVEEDAHEIRSFAKTEIIEKAI